MRFWNIVATRLIGLKALDLAVRVWLWDIAEEHKWLEDVARVRGLKEFVLAIKYPEVGGGAEADVGEDTKRFRKEVERKVKTGRHKQKWEPKSFDRAARDGLRMVQMEKGRSVVLFQNDIGAVHGMEVDI